jgi:hypothetical protein
MRRSWTLAAICALALGLVGCASLNLRPTDGVGATIAKVGGRALLFVPTLGMSEVALAAKRAEERYQARESELRAGIEQWRRAALEATDDSDRELALRMFDQERTELEQLRGHASSQCRSRVIGSQVVTPC